MTSPRSTPPADIASCHALLEQQWTQLDEAATRIETLEATITGQAAKIAEQQQTIEQLAADNASLKRTIFGSRRERFVDDEPQTPPRDACVPAPDNQPMPPASPVATGPKRTSRGRRRRILPEFLPREVRRHYLKPEEIPEEMRDNPRARRFFKKIGDKLEVIPMQLKIIEEYQEVIMLDQPDETLAYVAARRPASVVKSFAQPSVLAYLTVCRFADHLPYYRLENILGRSGCWIDRSTQWRWMRELASGVTRLVDLMWMRARQSSVLGMDETYVKELCGRGKARTGYLWVGVGDARHPYDCFFYTSSRQCAGPEAILAGFCGYLVADAYVAYERIGKLWEEVLKTSCWVHARRGFEACHALGPTAQTRQALAYFQQLFDIEDRYRTSDAATRQAARQRLSRPIVEAFHAWLVAEQKRRLPKDKLRGANDVAVSWLPRWVQVVDSRKIEQDATFDVVVTWGLLDLVERTSHLTCPTIDVQHGVFMHATWQSPLVAAATRAHELLGTTIVGVNEAVRQNFPEHVRDDVVIIPNGSDPGRVHSLVDRDELKASLGLSPEHKVVVYIGRIAVEKNVQALIDAVEHLDESWHAVIIGPQYVPLERLGPRVHLLPAQRRIGNWLGIADVLCHPSDYESHCFSINEAWLAGVPVVSCDYLVNRQFEERHGPLMWLVPTRPDAARLAAAIEEAYAGQNDSRVAHARDVASSEYAAPVMGRRWSDLIST